MGRELGKDVDFGVGDVRDIVGSCWVMRGS